MPPRAKQTAQSLSASQLQFIEDVAALMIPWGSPPAVSRLYGYLLMSAEPVGLDRIAADLEISKSSACNAARQLENHKLARRHSERGSKRVFYSGTNRFAVVLLGQSAALGELGKLLQTRASTVGSGSALKRMKDTAEFCLSMREAIDTAIEKLSAARVRSIREREK